MDLYVLLTRRTEFVMKNKVREWVKFIFVFEGMCFYSSTHWIRFDKCENTDLKAKLL